MTVIRHWQAISSAENDRIEAALLEYLDEDDALSALQVMMQHTVPATTYQGAVAENERLRHGLRAALDYLELVPDDSVDYEAALIRARDALKEQ